MRLSLHSLTDEQFRRLEMGASLDELQAELDLDYGYDGDIVVDDLVDDFKLAWDYAPGTLD